MQIVDDHQTGVVPFDAVRGCPRQIPAGHRTVQDAGGRGVRVEPEDHHVQALDREPPWDGDVADREVEDVAILVEVLAHLCDPLPVEVTPERVDHRRLPEGRRGVEGGSGFDPVGVLQVAVQDVAQLQVHAMDLPSAEQDVRVPRPTLRVVPRELVRAERSELLRGQRRGLLARGAFGEVLPSLVGGQAPLPARRVNLA
ncbi:hypothetical protein JOE53_002785 [Microbacterium laevaniformans]|nr:hypothetical protein [Microbacterium laevaniformans]MBM7754065.1 hypothetical protein [Microbacterium laevaniformans]